MWECGQTLCAAPFSGRWRSDSAACIPVCPGGDAKLRCRNAEKSLLKERGSGAPLPSGEQLGYLDQEMQIKGIEGYLEQQKSVRKEAEKEYREKEKVYHCLGIMGGLFL